LGPVTLWTTRADDGRVACCVRTPAPAQGPVDWHDDDIVTAFERRLLDRLAAVGLDLRADAAVVGRRTPADLAELTGAPGGTRPAWSTGLTGLRHPDNRAQDVEGLFHVGGSVHPGPGAAAVLMSAAIVADLVGRAPGR